MFYLYKMNLSFPFLSCDQFMIFIKYGVGKTPFIRYSIRNSGSSGRVRYRKKQIHFRKENTVSLVSEGARLTF